MGGAPQRRFLSHTADRFNNTSRFAHYKASLVNRLHLIQNYRSEVVVDELHIGVPLAPPLARILPTANN